MTPPSQTDPSPPDAGISLRVEEDPPPVVRALHADLAARLEDPAFVAATKQVRGTVALRDASTPQSATIQIDNQGVSLTHGVAQPADLRATVSLPGTAQPELEGAAEHPELAEWLVTLLNAEPPDWPDAAAGFWSVLCRLPGAPSALRVIETTTGEELRYGSEDGGAYELHGSAEDLVEVLCGRARLVDAAFAGRIFVRGSFPELSVLSGAGFQLRYGNGEGEASQDA